jgi:hypothetical protein
MVGTFNQQASQVTVSVTQSSTLSKARQRASMLPLLRLAKRPKWRMRTKPLEPLTKPPGFASRSKGFVFPEC